MKCLEIIELRTAEGNRALLEVQIQELIDEVAREMSRESVKAYFRMMIDTDFSIHLVHDSLDVNESGSKLGLHLTSILKELGLVNHSVWKEINQ